MEIGKWREICVVELGWVGPKSVAGCGLFTHHPKEVNVAQLNVALGYVASDQCLFRSDRLQLLGLHVCIGMLIQVHT
jgi:hypothetical protein